MQLELNIPERGRPAGHKGVKPRTQRRAAEHVAAASDGDLAKQKVQEQEKDISNLMDEILSAPNFVIACDKVKMNKGAPGIDGVTVEELDDYLVRHRSRIEIEIRRGKYRPQPVRRVEIPKPGGGRRMLGIPNVVDRVIQQAVLQVLTPVFDPLFSEHSYGFRPGRSAHQAVSKAREYMEAGLYWVVDIDIEKFFDRVNHDMLMARVARRVKDKAVLKLIRRYLQAGAMLDGVCVRGEEGVPQGGPLSPLLANILLDDLDKELEKRGHCFCRYADDCNIYVGSRKAGERVMLGITGFIEKKLKLKVNTGKSAVDRPSGRKFLGFTFLRTGLGVKIRIAPQSIQKLKEKIRYFTRRRWPLSIEERVDKLNKYLTGWMAYFALTDEPSILDNLTAWTRRRLRMCLWHQWKQGKTRFKNLVRNGVDRGRAYRAAFSSRGPWRMSINRSVSQALRNRYWYLMSLVNLSHLHLRFCKYR